VRDVNRTCPLMRKLTFGRAIMQVADMVDADRPSSAEQLPA